MSCYHFWRFEHIPRADVVITKGVRKHERVNASTLQGKTVNVVVAKVKEQVCEAIADWQLVVTMSEINGMLQRCEQGMAK